jgi:serine/threonine-protein kinase RsbW
VKDDEGPPTSEALRPGEIEIRLRADGARLSTVRAAAADVAMREDFDLDALSDLALAVDESCATILAKAKPDGIVRCRLRVTGKLVEFNASAATDNGYPPSKDSLGWHMLQVVTNSADCWVTEADGERHMHVLVTKLRP